MQHMHIAPGRRPEASGTKVPLRAAKVLHYSPPKVTSTLKITQWRLVSSVTQSEAPENPQAALRTFECPVNESMRGCILTQAVRLLFPLVCPKLFAGLRLAGDEARLKNAHARHECFAVR
jgi:hypothetical protein